MGSAAFILMIITLLSKVTGLIREQVTAYYLGTSLLTDAYSTATNIPFTIFGFVAAGVGASFIPIYNSIKAEKGVKESDRFTSNLANILLIVGLISCAFVVLFAPFLVDIFAPGYSAHKAELTANFTRVISFSIMSVSMSSVYIAYLNLKGSFTIPAMTGITMNFLHIISFVLAYKFNNFFIIAFGFVLADYLKYFLFPKAMKKEGYKHTFRIDLKDKNIRMMLRMSVPIIISIAAVDISTIIDQSLASLIYDGHGAVAALKYAILILQLVSGVIVVSIATAMYPKLSNYATERKYGKLKKTLMNSISYAQLIVVPAAIGLMILAEPIIRLLFQKGNFDAESTRLTASVLLYYLPSLFGLTVKDLTVRAFYAHRDIKTPVKVTVIQMIIQVILSITLSQIMGISGLALSTSIASIISGFIILILYRIKYGRINLKRFAISMVKILVAALIMGFFTYTIYHRLESSHYLLALVASIVVSVIVYAIAIVLLRIPEVKMAINIGYKKLKNRR